MGNTPTQPRIGLTSEQMKLLQDTLYLAQTSISSHDKICGEVDELSRNIAGLTVEVRAFVAANTEAIAAIKNSITTIQDDLYTKTDIKTKVLQLWDSRGSWKPWIIPTITSIITIVAVAILGHVFPGF